MKVLPYHVILHGNKSKTIYFFEEREFFFVLDGCDSWDAFFLLVRLQFLVQYSVPDEPTASEYLSREHSLRIAWVDIILVRF